MSPGLFNWEKLGRFPRNPSIKEPGVLKQRKLDLSTLNVVHLSLKMLLAPELQKRPKGDFVDEKKSGSKLLSYAICSKKR
ncbi:hypothetical protein GQ600_1287 [Phytophthora cactorum]|nr:hypothetical protein GQ600_1287 [Phytophthora cactorum]